ncbi:outer membrane protein [Acinetobacter calcoaceticus]|uniref:Outer membrane protein n=1 Tax=Acinetobacter calcoaceticus TaxID=471 RepID=A0A4R1Y137_ACICA|nr:outer membrane protein [Acinetobacter calcoaceticus]
MQKIALITLCMCSIHMAHAGLDMNRVKVRLGVTQIEPKDNPGDLYDGTHTRISNSYALTASNLYFLTPNVALDLLLGTAPKHDIYGNGQKIGHTRYLPPTLSVQYNFNPEGKINPYLGAGVNYTYYLNEKLLSNDKLSISNSFGFAATAGMEYQVNKHWSLGAEARYISVNSDIRINGTTVGNNDVNPMLYTLNLGYRF